MIPKPTEKSTFPPQSTEQRTSSYDLLLQALPDAAFIVQDGRWVAANRRALDLYGFASVEEAAKEPAVDRIHPSDQEAAALRLRRVTDGAETVGPIGESIVLRTGEQRHIEIADSPIAYRGRPAALCVARYVRESIRDPLTGLPTRVVLMDRLSHAIEQVQRRKGYVAVLFLDIDDFKVVNDSLGHSVGDQLLVAVAQRLSTTTRGGDTVVRFGGDEFIVLCDCVQGVPDATRLARRLTEAFEQPFQVGDETFHLSASIGIALGSSGDTPETLVRDADSAMHQAKSSGRNRADVFDAAVRARTVQRLDIDHALRRAIENREISLHFQPIVDLATGTVAELEALVRWKRRGGGHIPPCDFIPLAEENGLIRPLGRRVLELACEHGTMVRRVTGLPITIAVNLSTQQLVDDTLLELVDDVLSESGLPAEALRFEVTESRWVDDLMRAKRTFAALREIGVSLAIDDFGTGYSSLAQLRDLPFSSLKVDRSFVANLDGSEVVNSGRHSGEAMLEAIVQLGRALGMTVIAEGVETTLQLAKLRGLGCDHAQGYLLARPGPPEELVQAIQTGTIRSRCLA